LILSNNASDWGYTSGIRADIFYEAGNKQNFFVWLNKLAAPNSITTKGWGVMQKIFAPQKTSLTIPDRNDYPYSGALFAIHTIHSANSSKKINLKSEWIAGLMGLASMGEQTHRSFHRLIKDPAPMGWDYQLPTDLLLNYNIRAERLLIGNKDVSLAGTGEIRCGTMNDDISLSLKLQFGNNSHYFSGLKKQYFADRKIKFSLALQTSAGLIFYNALLQGGLFNSESPVHNENSKFGTDRQLQHLAGSAELSFLFSMRKLAVSFGQKITTSALKGHGTHAFGNISVYKTL
jgi:lipid A 3-O-deacylase